ncbi:MAG: hypothetical protein J5I47_04915 [Vicingus serpentipes]|nr:hypothetical protein [Vicingus serpentipes]
MTKKILIGIFILLIGAVGIIAFNFYKNVKKPVNSNLMMAVPQNAAFILQENNFSLLYNKIASTNIIWEELVSNTKTTQQVNQQLLYIDSLLQHSFKPFAQQPILTSAHLSGANHFDFIFYLATPENVTEEKLVQKIGVSTHSNPSQRAYDDINIYTIPTTNNNKIAFTFYKNIFAFSYSTVLIEDVIRQLNADNNLLDNPKFSKILATSGEAEDGNLYINPTYFSKIVSQFLNPSAKKYSTNLEHYANWSELDISIKPNALMLNGFTLSSDSSNLFLSLFKEQTPQKTELLNITPANTALLYYYGFSNAKTFFEKRKQLLKSKHQFFDYQKQLDEQSKLHEIDLEEELLNNIGNEMALIITEPLSDDYSNNQYVIFHSNEIEKATEDISLIALKVNKESYLFDAYQDYPIHKVDLKNVFTNLLGKPFVNFDSPFYTIINDYIVFAKTENAIKVFISDYKNEKTFKKNKNLQAFSENLAEDANLFVYLNIARSVNLFKNFTKADYLPIIEEKEELFRKFEAIAFQVNAKKNNLYYNNIFLKYNPVYKQDTRSLWEVALDSTISRKPQLVINHQSNTKEVFVQDDAHKIYLISNTGKIIWSKQLQEAIIGQVHQIDLYKNNKLQLLFNTKNKMYLLDRNGNNVEKFPIQLPSEATNGVTPLDYEKNKNYRLLIGCNNNMVYNYTAQGNMVEGWQYQAAESFANGKIWHTVFSGKDYIIIPLHSGEIKVVERSGKDRLRLKKYLPSSTNIALKKSNEFNKTYLTAIDNNGVIFKLFLNDKLEQIVIDKVEKDSKYDLNSNLYLFTYENKVKVVDEDKKPVFEIELENTISYRPLFFTTTNKAALIGLVSNRQIYLFNSEGKMIEGFPLAGSTPFSIADLNNDKTLNLVVGDGNKIYTYNLEELP